jgi:poly(3-hydroxyalkanoate) depolymerase
MRAHPREAPETVRSIVVDGQPLRVAIRPGQSGGARGIGGQGSAGRPPLLIMNGIGASLDLLQPFADALSPQTAVIRFDVPGVGGSPLPRRPYRFTGLSRLVANLLTALGHQKADVLGISWGGGLAQHFAAFQRGHCRRLVLVSTATGALMVPARPAVLARMITPRRYLDRQYLSRVAGDLYGGSARNDGARIAAQMHASIRVGSAQGYLYQLAAGAGWTSVPFLPFVRQPTLILSGDDDPLIPLANARLMRALIPGARLHVYHGGHLGLVTEAAALAPVVEDFLTE